MGYVLGYGIYIEPPLTKLPIGGRIFYDDGDNGATYKFFDSNNNEITNTSISGLANAITYAIASGTPSKDRFYVYDNTTHTHDSKTANSGLVESIYWGYYGTLTGITSNTIGSGKTNTQTIMNRGVPTDYKPNIWSYCKACNDDNLNDCNDWYIGSEAEQDKLRASSLVTWYNSSGGKYMWSSVEYDSNSAYYWNCDGSRWYGYFKYNARCCVLVRSF